MPPVVFCYAARNGRLGGYYCSAFVRCMWKLFKIKARVRAHSLRQRGFPSPSTILISILCYSLDPRIKNGQDLYVAKARVRVEYQKPDALLGGRI